MSAIKTRLAIVLVALSHQKLCFGKQIVIDLTKNSLNTGPISPVNFETCGSALDGVCVPSGQCAESGGEPNGVCDDWSKECCQYTLTCDANNTLLDVTKPVTILTCPEPSNTPCTFRFPKAPGICQVRLDFEKFETASANEDGDCVTDKLTIHNSITIGKEFSTCGNLNQQHMYLAHGDECSIDVTPVLKSPSSKYRIIATQIPCCSENEAPNYCLQFFTSVTDRVRSFDFGGQQQNNQRYNVCVKSRFEGSKISWKPCRGADGNAIDIVTSLPGAPSPCNTDWVQVKGLPKVCEPFMEQVSDWKPFNLMVNFDKSEFPPPPPWFSLPVDPANCPATCVGVPGVYDCACVGESENPLCQCIVIPGVPDWPYADLNNTGFCLDYVQI